MHPTAQGAAGPPQHINIPFYLSLSKPAQDFLLLFQLHIENTKKIEERYSQTFLSLKKEWPWLSWMKGAGVVRVGGMLGNAAPFSHARERPPCFSAAGRRHPLPVLPGLALLDPCCCWHSAAQMPCGAWGTADGILPPSAWCPFDPS